MSIMPTRTAPVGLVRGWVTEWWLRVPEPREMSVAFTFVYVAAFLTGLATLLNPPMSLSKEVGGEQVMASVGGLLIAGALIAMLGGARRYWKLERIGLGVMTGAIGIYGLIVLILHHSSTGSRLTQLGIIVIALMCFGVRFLMIWRFSFQPRI